MNGITVRRELPITQIFLQNVFIFFPVTFLCPYTQCEQEQCRKENNRRVCGFPKNYSLCWSASDGSAILVSEGKGWCIFFSLGLDYFYRIFVWNFWKWEIMCSCLFSFSQARAVHLRTAFKLDTDSLINVLPRSLGRWAAPCKIHGDSGANFVGRAA